ncbi:MAG: azurin, partial [Pseudomonadota bacterium]
GDAVDAAADAVDDAVETAADVADDAKDAAMGAMEDAGEAAAAVADAAGDAADAVMEEAGDAMDAAKEAVAGATSSDSAAAAEGPCALTIEAGDAAQFSTTELSAPASCTDITVTLVHTGTLPKVAMGHNWVLVPEDAMGAVAGGAVAKGVEGNYVADDDRIVAATGLVGGGESSSVTFSASDLEDGVTYMYMCTFPGHYIAMQGTFTIS